MPIPFQPPEWLIQEYMRRKQPAEIASEGIQQGLNTYMTLSNQQKQQALAQQTARTGQFTAIAPYVPEEQIPGLAQQYGVNIPQSSAPQPLMQPGMVEPNFTSETGGPMAVAPSGSPILNAWNAMRGPAQTMGGGPPLGPRPTSKFGQERYAKNLQARKLEQDLLPEQMISREQLATQGGMLNPGQKLLPADPIEQQNRQATIQLSNEFSQQSKDFRTAAQSLPAVVNAPPSAAGDMQMIFGLMKIYDPNSVVRETEFANAENARGVPEGIRARWNKVLRGERLSEKQRTDFKNSARNVYEGRLSQQKQLEAEFRRQGAGFGLDPNQIIRDYSVSGLPVIKSDASNVQTGMENLSEEELQAIINGR